MKEQEYNLIELREWIPFGIGAYLHHKRSIEYERTHPEIKKTKLSKLESLSLFAFCTWQFTTSLTPIILLAYALKEKF